MAVGTAAVMALGTVAEMVGETVTPVGIIAARVPLAQVAKENPAAANLRPEIRARVTPERVA